MDTTKLVVGQDVYVVSNDGSDFMQGKVTEVTPEGVEVLTAPHVLGVENLPQVNYDVDQLSWVVPMRFDNEGKGYGYDGSKHDVLFDNDGKVYGNDGSKLDMFWKSRTFFGCGATSGRSALGA